MREFLVYLPLSFVKFWFLELPVGLLSYFSALNKAYFQLFSLPLLIKTYFRPWKNEYREGLVGFSIAMGMFVKTCVIAAELVLFVFLMAIEVLLFVGIVSLPIATVAVLFFRPCPFLNEFITYACSR